MFKYREMTESDNGVVAALVRDREHNKSHLVRLDLEVVHNALDIRRDEKSYPHYKTLGVLENLCFA